VHDECSSRSRVYRIAGVEKAREILRRLIDRVSE
jgi:hypothetical protein